MTWLAESVRHFPTKHEAEQAWGSPLAWMYQTSRYFRGVLGFTLIHGPRWLGQTPTGLKLTVAIVEDKNA